ncbi:ccc1 family [Artemisia annua]|uniref:Ccc1 family n=1 Tax=Artemisia annua TaxID=35608 RepID=A0A2U1L8J7_ARTAN|nr:ccc1 family [Artemisia annua]
MTSAVISSSKGTTTPMEKSEHTVIKHDNLDVESQETQEVTEVVFDYAKRAQWLRASLLGANDGLLSTASLMMGVSALRDDKKTMILSGVAGLVAGACSMGIGEFVSVYSQYDIELSQIKREIKNGIWSTNEDLVNRKKGLPSPAKAASASAIAFAVGASVPLLAAGFISAYHVRIAVVIVAVTMALIGFGGLSAVLGRAPLVKSTLRILIGGWMAMGLTFGLTKAVDLKQTVHQEKCRECFLFQHARCGLPTVIRTTWRPGNPGRRFYCFPKPEPNDGFQDWVDPPMCARSVMIIPGLLNNMNQLQETARENAAKARENASKARRFKIMLGLSWLFFVMYLMMKLLM